MTRRELFGIPVGQVVDFRQVFVQVIKLPDIRVEIRSPLVEGDGLPAAVPDAPMADHLEVLHGLARIRVVVIEGAGHGHPVQGNLLHAVDLRWQRRSEQVHQRGCDVHHVVGLPAGLALLG